MWSLWFGTMQSVSQHSVGWVALRCLACTGCCGDLTNSFCRLHPVPFVSCRAKLTRRYLIARGTVDVFLVFSERQMLASRGVGSTRCTSGGTRCSVQSQRCDSSGTAYNLSKTSLFYFRPRSGSYLSNKYILHQTSNPPKTRPTPAPAQLLKRKTATPMSSLSLLDPHNH